MEKLSFYKKAHLIVAGIRTWEHLHEKPPAVEELSDFLSSSAEPVYLVCRKLAERGIIELVQGNYGDRVFLKDHLKIEDIPDDSASSGLDEELEKFKEEQKNRNKKIQDIKTKEEERKKSLFDQIEKQLKQNIP